MRSLKKVYFILIVSLLIIHPGCALAAKTPMQTPSDMAYCWTPDGKIAFYRRIDHWIKYEPDPFPGGGGVYEDYKKDDEAFIVVRDPNTKEEKVLFKVPYGHTATAVHWMDWSGVNNEILMTVFGAGIYRIKANGEGLKLIGDGREGPFGGFKQATWTPDGKNIMCIASHHMIIGLYITGADCKNPRMIVEDADAFSISPDGKQVVYQTLTRKTTREERKTELYRNVFYTSDIYIINTDGTGKRLLVEGNAAATPAWSPDGKWILYHTRSGWFVINPDDSVKKKAKPPISQPSSWSKDGKKFLGRDRGYLTDFVILENYGVK